MNDAKNLIIATGLFRAKLALPEANPNKPDSYDLDFGEFEKGTMKIEGDLKENFNSLNGTLGLDALRRVKAKLTYEFDAKYLSKTLLERIMGSASGAAPEPGKVFDVFGIMVMQGLGETVKADGSAIYNHHSFKAGVVFDGDLTMNGDDYMSCKMRVHVYLGAAPGLWTASATRPVPVPGP